MIEAKKEKLDCRHCENHLLQTMVAWPPCHEVELRSSTERGVVALILMHTCMRRIAISDEVFFYQRSPVQSKKGLSNDKGYCDKIYHQFTGLYQ